MKKGTIEQPLKTFSDYKKAFEEDNPDFDRHDVFAAWAEEHNRLVEAAHVMLCVIREVSA